jgi:hypothetical protein
MIDEQWRMKSMRLKRKSGYHHGELRRTLLDVSIGVIDKHGVDALNLRELAVRAGVSSGVGSGAVDSASAVLAAGVTLAGPASSSSSL